MGQQQVVLILLVTVIVGIATILAINTMSTTLQQNNIDVVRVELSVIAAQMQSYYQKPSALGGGSKSFEGVSFNTIVFQADTINASGSMAQNENGIYSIVSATTSEVVIIAQPSSGPAMTFENTSNTEITQRATVSLSDVVMRYEIE
ncbi:MAG: hypothetical protein JJ892_09710 [Balneola sp.]|nr:hypothetical protein [Balneola sp.]MBO6649785.1 hypothetical protein [Balneola sp.]MBO6712348.1 hypothetical protein [Balneola sp.]MBO6800542.1 hypothetical protein [Balneola sp.]MBO6871496.1 hypothetical protein [Balneola sp.]